MKEQPKIAAQSAIHGIFFMLLNTLSLSILDITAKTLRESFSSSLIVFSYKFGLFLLVVPWVFMTGGLKYLKTERIYIHIIRSLFGTLGAMLFIHGLHYIHMSDAAALENIQYLIVVATGWVIFAEKVTLVKVCALLLGLIGATVTVNPGMCCKWLGISLNAQAAICDTAHMTSDYTGYIYVMAAICCWSFNTIIIKILGNTEHNKTQMFYMLLFASIWSFPTAFFNWGSAEIAGIAFPIFPSFISFDWGMFRLEHCLLLSLMGACYFTHGVAYFRALKSELSVVVPFRYTKLIFSSALGYLLFNEIADPIAYIGYVFITCSGLLLLYSELMKARRKTR